jgi:Skp family chaperone for outer membrane proteins
MGKYIWAGVTALGLLAAASVAASAQEAPAAPVVIGVIDLDLVGEKFERKLQEEDRLTEWYRQQQQLLDRLGDFLFVAVEEWEEAVALSMKPENALTEEEKQRLQTLKEQGRKWETDYKNLEAKPDRNAEEQNRFSIIRDMYRARQADRHELAVQLEGELQQKRAQLGNALMEPVQAAVNKIAAERGLTVVLEKRWVYFGGEDITEAVIQMVNAAGAAAGADRPAGEGGEDKPEGAEGEKPPANEGGQE